MMVLETRQLHKRFGETRAVDDVNLAVGSGEVIALIGSNGAGKTTLVNLISGFFRPDAGAILFQGADVTKASIQERLRAGIARSFQLVNLFNELTTFDNVAVALFARDRKTRRVARLAWRDSAVNDEAMALLGAFGLGEKERMLAGGLSQGERKLLDIAVAYALRPVLLLLDEPTSGVSTREKKPIMNVIESVVRGSKTTAIIIEHDMDVVFTYSDRIVAMHEGAILADGTPDEIRENHRVTSTLLGTQVR
jgi:branched-chain amino acid transport system ATP-binding protein